MIQTIKPRNWRILIAPLDWGLGHATRCIPLIRALLAAGFDVVLAGDGKTATLLRSEFPQLDCLPLQGYGVQYGIGKWSTTIKIVQQVPKIKRAIKAEQVWLQKAVQEHQLNAVISDNRYGLYHQAIPSIFITHQLSIKTGLGRVADQMLQRFNYQYINRFTECWVPDAAEHPSLAGALAHPAQFPSLSIRFIGPLSRFQWQEEKLTEYVLILLSGPEPQRTLWEQQLLAEIKEADTPVFLVRGLPGAVSKLSVPYHVTVANHLPAAALQRAIEGATFVISRCGYSTVMDVVALRKKSILVPTPGQTEQEYLARYLAEEKIAFTLPQKKFKLRAALNLAATFPYQLPAMTDSNGLQKAITALQKRLEEKET